MDARLEPELAERITPTTSCWVWTGGRASGGYGQYHRTVEGQRVRTVAHRVVYERLVGPIPDGLVLDHLCRNILCVNPDHLEPVTRQVNTLRGIGPAAVNAVKTTCVRGHSLSGDNLLTDRRGRRTCRECKRERGRNWWRENRSAR